MAEEQKQSWWKSLPGLLTAASGFVAALSGLVAGLNQLGVFRRDQPAQQVVGVAPAARDSTAQHSGAPVTGGSASSAAPAPAPPLHPIGGHFLQGADSIIAPAGLTLHARAGECSAPRELRRYCRRRIAAAAEGHGARAGGAVADLRATGRPAAVHSTAGSAAQGGRRHRAAGEHDRGAACPARGVARSAAGAA